MTFEDSPYFKEDESSNKISFDLNRYVADMMKTISIEIDARVEAELIKLGWTPPYQGDDIIYRPLQTTKAEVDSEKFARVVKCPACLRYVAATPDGVMFRHDVPKTHSICSHSHTRGVSDD